MSKSNEDATRFFICDQDVLLPECFAKQAQEENEYPIDIRKSKKKGKEPYCYKYIMPCFLLSVLFTAYISRTIGINAGRKIGFDEGYDEEYDEGYDEGYDTGRDNLKSKIWDEYYFFTSMP